MSRHSGNPVLYSLALLVALTACDCDTQILNRVPSPNGELHAVRWTRNCGAMSSGSVGVTLLAAEHEFDVDDPLGTVFQYRIELPPERGFTPIVSDTVAWNSNSQLVIAFDARRPVVRQTIRLADVNIRFRPHHPGIANAPQN